MRATPSVQQRMDAYLRERGVDPNYAQTAGLRPVTSMEACRLGSPWKRDAILIPYCHPFDRTEHSSLVRFRYVCDPLPTDRGGKTAKFSQPKGSMVEAYFDPHIDWKKISEDPRTSLYFVEGEIKALAMNQRGLRAIGLGGVNSYGGMDMTPWCREVLR